MTPSTVRVRIAPSPTGNLHVGTARTALFNYLFAKGQGGQFILRVEDTDQERSQPEYIQNIYDGLSALGIHWDEGPDVGGEYGPYYQMERLDHYKRFAQALIDADMAYYSYETTDELEKQRESSKLAGKPYIYQRPSADVLAKHQSEPERTPTLRFKVPDLTAPIVVSDLVRGDVAFDPKLIGDFILQKSDGTPTFNFANVVDDTLMKITHIIRGEDHLSNTPKQILLYQAFAQIGLAPTELPQFAHVGMILAPDKSKLSKRHGATAVAEFIKQGYLPEAFCNFLALLGWSPREGSEVASLDDFARQFKLEHIAQSPAVFETDKLNWLNKQYIRQLTLPRFLELATPYLTPYDLSEYTHEQLLMILDAIREPITTLNNITDAVRYFFGHAVAYDAQVVGEVLMNDDAQTVLTAFQSTFIPSIDWSNAETIATQLKTWMETLKPLKGKSVMWPIRAALTSRVHGADLSKTIFLLGPEKVADRVTQALQITAQAVA